MLFRSLCELRPDTSLESQPPAIGSRLDSVPQGTALQIRKPTARKGLRPGGRSQRNFSFSFLPRGQKVKKTRPSGNCAAYHFHSIIRDALSFMFAVLPVRRSSWRINGKHKITFLCAPCDSAVNKILILNTKCLNNYCRIRIFKIMVTKVSPGKWRGFLSPVSR